MSGPEPINVKEAERLFRRFGKWKEVAKQIRRSDGGKYWPASIANACYRARRKGK